MASEITINESLTVRKSDPTTGALMVDHRSSDAVRADLAGSFGPSGGVITATTAGADVDLSSVGGGGGICRIKNQDASKYIEYGPYDPSTDTYMPLGELLPGEPTRLRLSRFLGEKMGLTGTAIKGTGITLRLKGVGGSVKVLVQVFPS